MMLYPSMNELSKKFPNRYMLVNVVAQLARRISERVEERHEALGEKPVTVAIDLVSNTSFPDDQKP